MATVTEKKKYWIGFDLGGTKMQCIVCDEALNVVVRRRKKTKGSDGTKLSLERIEQMIEKTLLECNATREELFGIGVGCPGPVEWEKGIVRIAVNLGWKNTPVGEYLSDRFQCPTSVLNDVDAGVYGEYCFGAALGARCAIGIFPGTGIGGGCVYEGKILRGKVLSCMEVGHIRISSNPHSTGISMPGTLEAEASRLMIAAECAKLAFRGEAPYLLEHFGTDLSKIRSSAIAEAIEHGDIAVERVVREACQQIGYAVVNLVHLITPDRIILGGGLVEALPQLMLDEVGRTVKKNVLQCYQDQYTIDIAKLGDDAGAMGAAAWAAYCHQPNQIASS